MWTISYSSVHLIVYKAVTRLPGQKHDFFDGIFAPRSHCDAQDNLISATTGLGLQDLLHQVEKAVLEGTGMSVRRLKVPMSGPHLR